MLTNYFANSLLISISASYFEGDWSRSIFVGFLFAIAAFLLAYNGLSSVEMGLSKVASLAALGVALFPCDCYNHVEIVPHIHAVCTAAMFLILAYFCYAFLQRALRKKHGQATARAIIYGLCGIAIIFSILALVFDHFSGGRLSARIARLTYYGELTGLLAFGISWLTASRVLPVITRPDERFSPFSDRDVS
jgi:small-conductance mechanosensitive channel